MSCIFNRKDSILVNRERSSTVRVSFPSIVRTWIHIVAPLRYASIHWQTKRDRAQTLPSGGGGRKCNLKKKPKQKKKVRYPLRFPLQRFVPTGSHRRCLTWGRGAKQISRYFVQARRFEFKGTVLKSFAARWQQCCIFCIYTRLKHFHISLNSLSSKCFNTKVGKALLIVIFWTLQYFALT